MGPRPTRWRRRLKGWILRHGGRRRAVLALAALSVGDVLLPALPTQMSVLALGSLQPQRWIAIALAFASAAAGGVVLMALLLSWAEAFAGAIARESLGVEWRSAAARVRAFWVVRPVRSYGIDMSL